MNKHFTYTLRKLFLFRVNKFIMPPLTGWTVILQWAYHCISVMRQARRRRERDLPQVYEEKHLGWQLTWAIQL